MAKITEKRLYAVSPQNLTVNGTSQGEVKVADSSLFVVGHLVVLASNTQTPLELKIKRIPDATTIWLGPRDKPIQEYTDVSGFLVADSAFLFANEQQRPKIPEQDVERATYDDEPIVARRVSLIDPHGDHYDQDNPIPVQVDTTVNIGDVRITAQDNDPKPGNIHSSVRVSDGIDDLAINPDGSINVVIPPGGGGIPVNEFNQIASVPASILTTVLTYTVPPPYDATLFRVEVGGNNIATYEIHINSSVEARIRTWFGTPLTQVFEFSSGASGFKLTTGDIVEIKVIHERPYVGDFEARLQAQLT